MVSKQEIDKQLKRLNFKVNGWGKSEVNELHNIILPDEEIFELANGIYEGGFALLVATDVRVLLVDKKPLNYLTVEDLRFDMINEIDYSHRLIGAQISIATGSKNLRFTSFNQQRLRKLIGHVQHSMADAKKKQSTHQEDQKSHLEKISEQLRKYLVAQQKYQERLQKIQLAREEGKTPPPQPEPVKPSPELADYLLAQGLMEQYKAQSDKPDADVPSSPPPAPKTEPKAEAKEVEKEPEEFHADTVRPKDNPAIAQMKELYAAGVREIFGKHYKNEVGERPEIKSSETEDKPEKTMAQKALEVNPITIAYSKLPMALRNRKFGSPSFHAHSAAREQENTAQPAEV